VVVNIIKKIDGNSGNKKQNKEAVAEEERNEMPVVGTVKVPNLPAVCHHNIYEEDITYTAEQNASFCKEGYYLFGLKCTGCTVGFIAPMANLVVTNQSKVLRYTAVLFYCMGGMQEKGATGKSAGMPFVVAAGKRA
jgi:hypothetical protein